MVWISRMVSTRSQHQHLLHFRSVPLLLELSTFLQLSVGSTNSGVYSVHQLKGDSSVGNNKTGYLSKRSEGRLRNVWQKRKCQARDSFLEIYHADLTKAPTRVNLLTCQMRPVSEDRLCFDVVSYNRTYHFQAENDVDRDEWMSVLLNSKERALNQAFHNEDNGTNNSVNQSFMELQKTLVAFIRGLPGNDRCCDCGSQNGNFLKNSKIFCKRSSLRSQSTLKYVNKRWRHMSTNIASAFFPSSYRGARDLRVSLIAARRTRFPHEMTYPPQFFSPKCQLLIDQ